MAGFNLPIQAIPPQLLAEMARAAFKPPALMSGGGGGGGGGMGALPQAPGFDVQGASKAALGLGGLGAQLFNGPGIDDRTRAIDAEIADWSTYGTPQQPQASPGMFDFLSNMKMPSFGGGGFGGGGFTGGGSSGFGG